MEKELKNYLNKSRYSNIIINGNNNDKRKCLRNKIFDYEMKHFNSYQYNLISNMRHAHCLNNFNKNIKNKICNECNMNVNETVLHYLLECNKYKNERKILENKFNMIYNYEMDFNYYNLIFPRYYKNEKEIRIEILRFVLEYIYETKRFKKMDKDEWDYLY